MTAYPPVRTGEHFEAQGPSIGCLTCGGIVPLTDHLWLGELFGVPSHCPSCREELDLRACAAEMVATAERHPLVLGLVGAWMKGFSLVMRSGETALVDLDVLGLPPEARLVQIRVTEGSGFIATEVTPTRRPNMQDPPRSFVLHAFPDESRSADTKDFLCWAVHTFPRKEDSLLEGLVEPFLRLSEGDRRMLPLLLFAVVETGIRRVVRRHYASFTTPAKAKSFAKFLKLDDAFSIIVPSVVGTIRDTLMPFPQMRQSDVDRLIKLKDKRNTVSHRLMQDDPTTDEIVSALFVAVYLHYLEQVQLGSLVYDPNATE